MLFVFNLLDVNFSHRISKIGIGYDRSPVASLH